MNKPVSPAAALKGEEHWTNKGSDVRLFLWNKYADPIGARRPHPVRARLVDGLDPDLRPAGARPALADGILRGARLRLLVRRHGGLRALDQGPQPQLADLVWRRRLLRGRELHREAARQEAVAGLRHLVGRAARRHVCRASSRDGRAACLRRHGVDRRRLADARRAGEEAARIPRQAAPADRPQVRALDLRARSSRHRRRQRDRGVRRRDPQARRFDPERHLRRHVLEPAGVRSREDQGGDTRSCAANTTASPA